MLHCADTPNGNGRFTAKRIDEWHAQRGFWRTKHLVKNGLWSIGYHYVIHVDGAVVQGRTLSEVGAHCAIGSMNYKSVGICMIGRDKFTQPQWDKLRELVTDVSILIGRGERAPLHGHRDFDRAKTCPGFDVQTWVSRSLEPDPEWICKERTWHDLESN